MISDSSPEFPEMKCMPRHLATFMVLDVVQWIEAPRGRHGR
jgi:hypothetical protein